MCITLSYFYILPTCTCTYLHVHVPLSLPSFFFEKTSDQKDYTRMFTVSPSHSTLQPGEKAQSVGIVFKATKEVCIKTQPILICQVSVYIYITSPLCGLYQWMKSTL